MNFILDASAILNNFLFKFEEDNKYYITPQIANEFKDIRSRLFLENALRFHNLKIVEPREEFIREAESLNKNFELSSADVSVLALALQFKHQHIEFIVITDDKKLQRFLQMQRINFESVIR